MINKASLETMATSLVEFWLEEFKKVAFMAYQDTSLNMVL
jgi:hypothetical protein